MERNSVETETLARLYLEQGHPERAVSIYERLVAEDPGRASAVEGLESCRVALCQRRAEEGMNAQNRLRKLQSMLSRLTGEAPPPPASEPPRPEPPERPAGTRLDILQSMLKRLDTHDQEE